MIYLSPYSPLISLDTSFATISSAQEKSIIPIFEKSRAITASSISFAISFSMRSLILLPDGLVTRSDEPLPSSSLRSLYRSYLSTFTHAMVKTVCQQETEEVVESIAVADDVENISAFWVLFKKG